MQRAFIEDGKVIVDRLEVHASFSCNLRCESCSHFSNHGHREHTSSDTFKSWLESWQKKLLPKTFNILGGEPAANPELGKLIQITRESFPDTNIFIITNGLLLRGRPELADILLETKANLSISYHSHSPKYIKLMKPVRELALDWGLRGINVSWIDSTSNWYRRYQGFGSGMSPYNDGSPRKSWEICKGRDCVQLYDSCLWKCAPLAYLPMQDKKFKLDQMWKKYLNYQPLDHSASLEQIVDLYNREDELFCEMCPSEAEFFIKDPWSNEQQNLSI